MCAKKAKQAPHPWSKDALLLKAQRYAETMSDYAQNDWQFGLWSSLVLELSCRAVVANVSPALLAEKSNWNNLYFALGHTPTVTKFVPKSVTTADVLERLESVCPGFTPEMKAFCLKHTGARNEELHSGAMPFEGVGTASWLPMFYSACQTLLEAVDLNLAYLFGADTAKVAKTMIEALADETGKAAKKIVADHKSAWQKVDTEEKELLVEQATVWASRHEGHRVKCPACSSSAIVVGSAVAPPIRTLSGDIVIEKQDFLPAKFECIACGMKVSGLSQLTAMGLGDAFTATHSYEAAELYAQEPEYEPDFNEM